MKPLHRPLFNCNTRRHFDAPFIKHLRSGNVKPDLMLRQKEEDPGQHAHVLTPVRENLQRNDSMFLNGIVFL